MTKKNNGRSGKNVIDMGSSVPLSRLYPNLSFHEPDAEKIEEMVRRELQVNVISEYLQGLETQEQTYPDQPQSRADVIKEYLFEAFVDLYRFEFLDRQKPELLKDYDKDFIERDSFGSMDWALNEEFKRVINHSRGSTRYGFQVIRQLFDKYSIHLATLFGGKWTEIGAEKRVSSLDWLVYIERYNKEGVPTKAYRLALCDARDDTRVFFSQIEENAIMNLKNREISRRAKSFLSCNIDILFDWYVQGYTAFKSQYNPRQNTTT